MRKRAHPPPRASCIRARRAATARSLASSGEHPPTCDARRACARAVYRPYVLPWFKTNEVLVSVMER